jgi:aspartate-semialdehyde dehydrogenase
MSKKVAVVGATGAVGRKMIECLERSSLAVGEVNLFASARSKGLVLHFKKTPLRVQELTNGSLKGHDFALFSAGAGVSREFAPGSGTVVIDNSSAWRMDPNVPLVVPEVNSEAIRRHRGIIANPNCSTIQMVVVLKPLHDAARVRRVVVSTYQAVSGAGQTGVSELAEQSRADVTGEAFPKPKKFPAVIAANVFPHSNQWKEGGYVEEELKMMNETRKIMGDDSIRVSATCVRVPVVNCHSEAVNVETEKPLSADEARAILAKAPGIALHDYPTPRDLSGRPEVFVGRIRKDPSHPSALDLWIVADNLLKGAALNAVQIAERL